MGRTYIARDIDSGVAGFGNPFSNKRTLLASTAAQVDLTGSVGGGLVDAVVQEWVTDAGEPGIHPWSIGPGATWAVDVNIITGNANVSIKIRVVRRRANGGTLVTNSSLSAAQTATAGIHTFNLPADMDAPAGGPLSSDRLEFRIQGTNSTKTVQSFIYRVNTVESEFRTPIFDAGQVFNEEVTVIGSIVASADDILVKFLGLLSTRIAVVGAQDRILVQRDRNNIVVTRGRNVIVTKERR